jgi:recombination protein U
VKEWQLDYLVEHENLGAEAFILLSYGLQGFYRIPVLDWYFMKNRFGKVSITEEDVQQYKVEFNGFTIKFLEGLVDEKLD